MKKKDRGMKKLRLHRETLAVLRSVELMKVEGGLLQQDDFKCTGCDSGCGIDWDTQ